MKVKGSRFARMSYARRAAQLADECEDWRRIYEEQIRWQERDWVASNDALVIRERYELLGQAARELRVLANAFATLR